jgi:hypothetical protein
MCELKGLWGERKEATMEDFAYLSGRILLRTILGLWCRFAAYLGILARPWRKA